MDRLRILNALTSQSQSVSCNQVKRTAPKSHQSPWVYRAEKIMCHVWEIHKTCDSAETLQVKSAAFLQQTYAKN